MSLASIDAYSNHHSNSMCTNKKKQKENVHPDVIDFYIVDKCLLSISVRI